MASKKSQSSLEFLVLMSMVFLFFIGMVSVVGVKMIDYQEVLRAKQIQDVIDIVRTEVQLASTSMEGYQRSFYLPATINGKEYEIGTLRDRTFVLLYENKRYEYDSPDVLSRGTIYKGKNFIAKTKDGIHVNSSDPCQYLDPGQDSYCIGETCYCENGFYDSHCDDRIDYDNDPLTIDESDGVLEGDTVVDHCGNISKAAPDEPIPQIDCIAIDPCNIPPQFNQFQEPSIVPASAGEESVKMQFSANEIVSAVVRYTEIVSPDECTGAAQMTSEYAAPGFFEKDSIATVTVMGLVPEKLYCAVVRITDTKGQSTTSDPSPRTVFSTLPDSTPPFVENPIMDINIAPESGRLATKFKVEMDIHEPSGLNLAESKLIINRTESWATGVSSGKIMEAPLIRDLGGKYYAEFTVEGTTDNKLIDPNASFDYVETKALFYNTLNAISFMPEHSALPNQMPVISGTPESQKARFSNGVSMGSDADGSDLLKYTASGNLDKTKGTIEFWVKTIWNGADTEPDYAYLFDICNYDPENPVPPSNRMAISKQGSKLTFLVVRNSMAFYRKMPLDAWTSDRWHFIAATWDSAAHTGELYIDGDNQNSETSTQTMSDMTAMPEYLFIGSDCSGNNPAKAAIDQFAIFNYIKSKDQIAADMNTKRAYSIDLYLKDSSDAENEAYHPQQKSFEVEYVDPPAG